MITTKNYSNCSDLDTPELFVIMDFKWARENEDAIRNTPGVEYLNVPHGIFYITNPNARLLFAMRWP